MTSSAERPAFYALRPGGWRDLVTLLHLPYTGWHLSYVAFGAAAAPHLHAGRLAAALGGFFLGVGVSAHTLDELHDRPLGTQLSDRALRALAAAGLAGALALGALGIVLVSAWLAVFMAAGTFALIAYNLELFGGRFHGELTFALAWGALPALTGYFVNSVAIRPQAVLVALGCAVLSVAQRRLSTPVRTLRRRTVELSGTQRLADGTQVSLSPQVVGAPLEGALSALSLALVLLAAGLVVARL